MEKIVIIGAGPAGLTLAYELLKTNKYNVTVLEKSSCNGGLSKTFSFNENKVDIGGHRFYTDNERVQNLWEEINSSGGEFMTVVNRSSHIMYNNNFYQYPLNISYSSFKNLGFGTVLKVAWSYFKSSIHKREEKTLEDLYINRFGNELYKIFFKDYTYKLWGAYAKNMPPYWGRQRIQGTSLIKAIINSENERSLTDKFYYPVYGAGQMWDMLAQKIIKLGGNIVYNCNVKEIHYSENQSKKVVFIKDDEENIVLCDTIASSMPLNEFISAFNNAPDYVKDIANALRYRDMIIVAVSAKKAGVSKNYEKCKSDNWVYLQGEDVKAGRIQILNNWSDKMVRNGSLLFELEYYCGIDDDFYAMSDEEIISIAESELQKLKFISNSSEIGDTYLRRINKAYPIYDSNYKNIKIIENWINTLSGIYCIGRNAQHRYNNMDHSMLTGLKAFDCIESEIEDKSEIWSINTGDEYIEKNY